MPSKRITPVEDRHGFKILRVLDTYGTMTMPQALTYHGDFGLPDHRIRAEYTKLVSQGFVVRHKDLFIVTDKGRRHIDETLAKSATLNTTVAPPRTAPAFRPLSKAFQPPTTGTRPEAEFWRNLPSKFGDK